MKLFRALYHSFLIVLAIGAWWFITKLSLVVIYGMISVYVLHFPESSIMPPHGVILWFLYILAYTIGTLLVIPCFLYRRFFRWYKSRYFR